MTLLPDCIPHEDFEKWEPEIEERLSREEDYADYQLQIRRDQAMGKEIEGKL